MYICLLFLFAVSRYSHRLAFSHTNKPQSLYDRVRSILLYQYQLGLTICMYIVPNTLTRKLRGRLEV